MSQATEQVPQCACLHVHAMQDVALLHSSFCKAETITDSINNSM